MKDNCHYCDTEFKTPEEERSHVCYSPAIPWPRREKFQEAVVLHGTGPVIDREALRIGAKAGADAIQAIISCHHVDPSTLPSAAEVAMNPPVLPAFDSDRARCHHCDRPHATDEEWETFEEDTRDDLCWSGVGGVCIVDGVDWRKRALKAEAKCKELKKEIDRLVSEHVDGL